VCNTNIEKIACSVTNAVKMQKKFSFQKSHSFSKNISQINYCKKVWKLVFVSEVKLIERKFLMRKKGIEGYGLNIGGQVYEIALQERNQTKIVYVKL